MSKIKSVNNKTVYCESINKEKRLIVLSRRRNIIKSGFSNVICEYLYILVFSIQYVSKYSSFY